MTRTSASDIRPILIVGGGICGMAFAIRARALGYAVTIAEADPQWRAVGAGISITGPTYRALKHLGLLEAVRAEGYFIATGNRICAPDGTVVAEMPMQPLAPDLPTVGGILRPTLHRIFAERVRELGVDIRLGLTVGAFNDRADHVTASFSDRSSADFEFVVGADGAFSSTRAMLFPDAPEPSYTGQYCWRMLARRPDSVDRPHFFMGYGITAGLMPVSQDQMYLWLLETVPAKRHIADEEAPEGMRALLAPFGGPLAGVRDVITDETEIISRPLDAVLLPKPWHRGRTVLIGDAAHATTPHLASGAGIAIEDALVLADELKAGGSCDAVFTRFADRRFERCRLVVENSVGIGRMQQTAASPHELNALMSASQAALAADI